MDGTPPPAAARHSALHHDWLTPVPIITAAWQTMGGIDLDPASDADANERVRATTFYDQTLDGLTQPWTGRIFLNPPGGQVSRFWNYLVGEYAAQRVEQAIWVGYSLEQLQTLQISSYITPLDFPLCITKHRIAFELSAAQRDLRRQQGLSPATSPSHSNYLCYIGTNHDAFRAAFVAFGKLLNLIL